MHERVSPSRKPDDPGPIQHVQIVMGGLESNADPFRKLLRLQAKNCDRLG
jgi:hypothetical protein